MKILMVGLGGVGQRHARNIRTLLKDEASLIAYRVRGLSHVVTPTLQADAESNVEETLGIRAFGSLEDVLAERPDAAFICNPTAMHVPVATSCVEAGCDVFIEKPLSDSLDGIENLIQVANRNKRIVMVGYQLRFHPCLLKLRAVLESGRLGRLLSVRATVGEYLRNWHPYEDYRESYAAKAALGGGVVLTQIHELDYLYSLFGLPRTVYAIGGHWSHLEIDVEDTASMLMECSIDGRPLPVHLHQDYLQSPVSRRCEVIGDRGRAILDFPSLSVTVQQSGADPEVYDYSGFERNQLFLGELTHFFACVEQRKPPIVSLQEGLQSLRIALAVRESMKTKRVVELGDSFAVEMRAK